MTEQQKKMKKYCNGVERRLNLPRDVKTRVMNDFISSIAARREAGETDEAIFAELGTPKEAAAVLNEQMKDYAYRKSPWRWGALAVAAVGGMLLLWDCITALLVMVIHGFLQESSSLGIIGGADGPTAIFVTSRFSWEGALFWAIVFAAGVIGWYYLNRLKEK